MTKSLLIVFVKNPVLGKVKTRLAKTIGDQKALEVYKDLLRYTKQQVDKVEDIDKVVYYDSAIVNTDLWSEGGYDRRIQYQGGLGERMQDAFEQSFLSGYESVCIIGSDCYQLTSEILNKAFEKLNTKDVVIGPANDGGYYLLGMKEMIKSLFINKSWSTDLLIHETLKTLTDEGHTYKILQELIDVDNEDDLISSGYILP